jgi:hypothetical protein
MAIVQLEGLGQLKNPVPSGIEPATFQPIAWCLNRLPHAPALLGVEGK